MRAPLEWLADYVDIDLTVDALAQTLTMSGLKVEGIERLGADWQEVIVGEVLNIKPHPESRNPLWVAEINIGRDDVVTVVTGAPNVCPGDKVPIVLAGGVLPHGPNGEQMVIERRPMAGITSEGMLASERELGVSEAHAGIFILPPDAPVGEPLSSVLGGEVLDIETHPNRPDTLSMIGVAREVAATTQQQITPPDLDRITGAVEWLDEESIRVDVEASDLCPRYSALRVEGVQVLESPLWLRERLQAAGMRAINLVVDLTNYVMLEYGQPMHAFDAQEVAGNRIIVRRARDGEEMRTLDGLDRILSAENLVIADADRAVAIAGVMGGENSEISSQTTSLILESATFNPISVRRTARSLDIRTESSSRFEKDLPPEQTVLGLKRYLQLLAQLAPGPLRVARITDVYVGEPAPRQVTMPMRDLHRLTGVEVPAEDAIDALSLLGFKVEQEDDSLCAEVPFHRRADIELSADLVEEVIRIVGYDTIPSTLTSHTMPPLPLPKGLACEGAIGEVLRGFGINEVATHALTSPALLARLFTSVPPEGDLDSSDVWMDLIPNPKGVTDEGAQAVPVRLLNPATLDRQVLRLALLPSLLDITAANLRHTEENLAFYEIARTFFNRPDDLPYERRTLSIALAGLRLPASWDDPAPGPYNFYDLKGILASVLEMLRIRNWEVIPRSHPALHPGRAASITSNGRELGWFGELHPETGDHFELDDGPVQVAEIDLDALLPLASGDQPFRPLPRYPAAKRDVAVIVDANLPAGEVMDIIRRAGGETLEAARIFDVYRGENIPDGRKSIAVSLSFRSRQATLTEDQVAVAMVRIVEALRTEAEGALRE